MDSLGNRLHMAPFVRLLIPFILGIIFAVWLLPQKSQLYYVIPFICALLLIFFRRTTFKYDFTPGLIVMFIFLSLGFSIALNNRDVPKKLGYGRYYAVLDEYPIERGKSYKAIIRLTDSKIKVLAYFGKTDELISSRPGTLVFFEGYPELIENHGNPFEFDYKGYSLRQRIGHRIYLKSNSYYLFRDIKILNLQNKALILREKLLKILADNGVKGETFRVISAITLGARDNLDPETTESFTRTGTLHVLAVSGGNGSYGKIMNKLAKANVLVIDDLGLAPMGDAERRDLLEIIEDRHGNASTIITSQLPIDNWHEQIGDPTIADAILDRLIHNAHKIHLKGKSMRKKELKEKINNLK